VGNIAQSLGARMRHLAPSYWLFWKGKSKGQDSLSLDSSETGGRKGYWIRALAFLLLLLSFVDTSFAHGRFIEPPSRVSSWRFGGSSPHHHNDHGTNCGGFKRQWQKNGGRCGVCGDPWDLPQPRDGERGGTFGNGKVVRTYAEGQWATVSAQITANHKGFFEFRLCAQNRTDVPASESCMNRHVLEVRGGGTRYMLPSGTGIFSTEVALPKGLTCAHCVLQWRYVGGNNWGICPSTGIGETGCGPQEEFRACSDIAITPGGDQKLTSGVFDLGFGNDLGGSWSKLDPVGKEHLLHQEGWSPISAPLNLLSSPVVPSLPQPPPVLSSWPSTSLKPPDPPSWLVQQTFLPITSNQVAESRMGELPPQQPVVGPALLPSLLTPWTSSTRQHQSNPQLHSSRRRLFHPPSIQSRRQQPLMRRRRPPMVVRRKPSSSSKPKSGWNSWINISWGPKTPIWPLTLLHPQQAEPVQEVEPVQEEEEELAAYSEVNYSNRWEGGFSFFSSTRGRKKRLQLRQPRSGARRPRKRTFG